MSKSRKFQQLIDIMSELKPATPKEKRRIRWRGSHFFEWHKKNELLNIKQEERDEKTQDYPIKRIRLKIYEGEGILDITYPNLDNEEKNPRKRVDVVYVPHEQVEQIKAAINYRQWNMLSRMGEPKMDWSRLSEHYKLSAGRDYPLIHRCMLKQFVIQLNEYVEQHPEVRAINLVDAGCGQAPQLLQGMYDLAIKLTEAKGIVIRALVLARFNRHQFV